LDCVVDADDLLFLLWKLFKENKQILDKYRKVYKYILVDEAQDNNSLQYELFSMLAYPENNIFLVGDDDQSMYGFRGARPDQFIYFKQVL
jgi:DNA helicase-2/ATP-dependent DNA helicase PcrA